MIVINYVHKLQGLDKSLPICLEFRQRTGARVISIIELESGCSPVDLLGFKNLGEACSDQWVVLTHAKQRRPRHRLVKIIEKWQRKNLPATKLIDHLKLILQPSLVRGILQDLAQSREQIILLTIYNGVETLLGGWLSRMTAKKGGVRLGYLKSLHDQGLGLSDLEARSSNLTQKITLKPCLDALLAPDLPAFQCMLQRKGVNASQMIIAGYPPLYPKWQALVREQAHKQKRRLGLRVILYTRGEVAHKPSSEQIIRDEWLYRAINDLREEIERRWSEYSLGIKPHPYQERRDLEDFCERHPNVELVDGPPCLLAASADLAIATYSSSILDAVAAGVPSLEFFQPTAAFKRLHPDGSPFPAFGVRRVSNRRELSEALDVFASGHWQRCDKINELGIELDLESIIRISHQAQLSHPPLSVPQS